MKWSEAVVLVALFGMIGWLGSGVIQCAMVLPGK